MVLDHGALLIRVVGVTLVVACWELLNVAQFCSLFKGRTKKSKKRQ